MPIKIIQIGVGVRGGHWIDFIRLHPDMTTVACVDERKEALQAAEARLGSDGVSYFATIERALAEVPADVALIATPSALHGEHALLALEARLAVMTEKPLAVDVRGAKRVLERGSSADRPVIVAENYRYWPAERTVRKLVTDGTLGRISQATFVDYRNQPRQKLPAWVNDLPHPHLQEIGVHHFDSMRAIFARDAVAVNARLWSEPWSGWTGFSSTEALIEMADGLHVQYCSTLTAPYFSFFLRIRGEKADLWTNRKYVFVRERGKRFYRPVRNVSVPAGDGAKYPRGGTTSLLNGLRDALRGGAPAETRGEDNIRSLAIVEAARISHQEGRRVRLEEVL